MKAKQEKILNSLLEGIRPMRPDFGVALSAVLTYEDTQVGRGAEKSIECWSLARMMASYKCTKWSRVDYATLPTMWAD